MTQCTKKDSLSMEEVGWTDGSNRHITFTQEAAVKLKVDADPL